MEENGIIIIIIHGIIIQLNPKESKKEKIRD